MKRLTRECMDEYARNFTGRKSDPVTIWYGMGVWKRKATIKAMIPRWKPARQKPVKAGTCMCICVAWTDPRPCPFPAVQEQGKPVLDGRDVVVGFDRSQWSARCASSSTSGMATSLLPVQDEGLKEYSGEWKARNERGTRLYRESSVRSCTGIQGRKAAVHECLRRLYRFVVNPGRPLSRNWKAGNRSSDRKGDDCRLYRKTFIIYDMCKGEQIGIFAKSEEFRRIVHKEMSKVAQ